MNYADRPSLLHMQPENPQKTQTTSVHAKTNSPACCGTGQVILAACQATNTGAGSSILAASAGAVPKACAQGC